MRRLRFPKVAQTASVIVLTTVLALVLTAALAPAQQGRSPAHPPPPARGFVSLVPACACGRRTSLELFSTRSGRLIRRVAAAPTGGAGGGERLSQSTSSGLLLLTLTAGPRCDTPSGGAHYVECPRWVPGSCRNIVDSLAPGQTYFTRLFTISGRVSIGASVPDPSGGRVALTTTPCVSIHGTTGLFLRSLRSGRMRALITGANRCDSYEPVAWNGPGTELAFVLTRAGGRPVPMAGGTACPAGHDYLALLRVRGLVRSGAPSLIEPGHGCIFRAVAFDARGPVAVEGCNRHSPPAEGGNHLGQGILVQYGPRGRALVRRPLALGVEDATIAAIPQGGGVLVTQDQPANSGYRPRDYVWQFNGRRLRPISSYRASDADQILAIPW